MKGLLTKILLRKAALAVAIPVALAGMAGGSYAVATSVGAPSIHAANVNEADVTDTPDPTDTETPSPEPSDSPEEAHGGAVPRFHGDATTACPLPDGSTLSGNWTHGDYVSAWAATGDHAATETAAHSPCGKMIHTSKPESSQGSADVKGHAHEHESTDVHGSSGDHQGDDGDVNDDNGSNDDQGEDVGDAGDHHGGGGQGDHGGSGKGGND